MSRDPNVSMRGRLTQRDNNGDDHRSPERDVPEQDYDFVVEVVALEEGVDDDPK